MKKVRSISVSENEEKIDYLALVYKKYALDFTHDLKYFHICIYEDSEECKNIQKYLEENNLKSFQMSYYHYDDKEMEDLPYYRLLIYDLSNDILDSSEYGNEYKFTRCEYCHSGAELQNTLYMPVKRLIKYDMSYVLPEIIISEQLKSKLIEAGVTGCEYGKVIDKKSRKVDERLYQLKILSYLPPVKSDTSVSVKGECEKCGMKSIILIGTLSYSVSDFSDKKDFYLTTESHHRKCFGKRFHEIVISKKVKEILDEFDKNQYSYGPIHFGELFDV